MKLSVKTLAVITISVFLANSVSAQLKLPVVNGIGPDIKKVIKDYPNQFSNLQGELLIEHPQSADYACNFKVTGAEQALVTRYSSTTRNISSWQALMLTTEEFENAKNKYKALFTQLNNLSITMDNGSVFHLKGMYEAPTEEKKFASALFSFGDDDEAMKKLKVELVMLYELMEWKVKILVYEREREDRERGSVVE